MPHEILQNGERRRLNVHITPVHPRVVRPQRRRQQPVSRPRHKLPPARLRRKPVTTLHILIHHLPKILLDNRDLPKVHRLLLGRLNILQALDQHAHRIVLRIRH